MATDARPTVAQATIVPTPRPGEPGTSSAPIGIVETMANSKPAMKTPRATSPTASVSSKAASSKPHGIISIVPRTTLRSLPHRSVRAADVVEAASSNPPIPNVTAARPMLPNAEDVLEPRPERHEQRLRRGHQTEHAEDRQPPARREVAGRCGDGDVLARRIVPDAHVQDEAGDEHAGRPGDVRPAPRRERR